LTKNASVAVTYAPPAPPASGPAPSSISSARASRVGAISAANGKVTVTLACAGAAGTTCNVALLLTTTERLKGHKITGLLARNKVVKVASANVTIPAGRRVTVTLKPNATGRSLLARFKKLPALLTASSGTGRLFSQTLTIKPPRRHH
jgi:hypothetical protein